MTTSARILRSLSISSKSPVRRPKLVGSTREPDFTSLTVSLEMSSGGTRSEPIASAAVCSDRALTGRCAGAVFVVDSTWSFLLHDSEQRSDRASNGATVTRKWFTTDLKSTLHPRSVNGQRLLAEG